MKAANITVYEQYDHVFLELDAASLKWNTGNNKILLCLSKDEADKLAEDLKNMSKLSH